MISREDHAFARRLLEEDDSHHEDSEEVWRCFFAGSDVLQATNIDAFESVTRVAIEAKWSRRKLYALVDEACRRPMPEAVQEEFENYIDGLVGRCAWDYVIRLHRDPQDQLQVCKFARSGDWIHRAYYE